MLYTMVPAKRMSDIRSWLRIMGMAGDILEPGLEIICGDIDDDAEAVNFICRTDAGEIAAMIKASFLDAHGEGCDD